MSYWRATPPGRNLMAAGGQPYDERLQLPPSSLFNGTGSDYFMRLRGARLLNGLDLPPRAINEGRNVGTFMALKEDIVQASVGVLETNVVVFDAGRSGLELVSHDGNGNATRAIAQAVDGGSVDELTQAYTDAPTPGTEYEPGGIAAQGTLDDPSPVYVEEQAPNPEYEAQRQATMMAGLYGAAAAAVYQELPQEVYYEPPPADVGGEAGGYGGGYVYDGSGGGGGGGGGGGYVPTYQEPVQSPYIPGNEGYNEWSAAQDAMEQLLAAGVY